MTLTLTEIRDRYDTNKNRYIDNDEVPRAQVDYNADIISMSDLGAVFDANSNHTLLPAYSSTIVTCATGCDVLLECDTNNDGIIDMNELFAATDRTDLTTEEKAFVGDAYNAGSINALCPGCYGTAPPTVAQGKIVNVSYPTTASNGANIMITAQVENEGDATGAFRIAFYEIVTINYKTSSTLIYKSPTKTIYAGSVGGTITHNRTVPSSGTSVKYTLKCLRVT